MTATAVRTVAARLAEKRQEQWPAGAHSETAAGDTAATWHTWTGRRQAAAGPSMTLHSDGRLRISPEADRLLGMPAYVRLRYSVAYRAIAVQACQQADEGARRLKTDRVGGFRFSAEAFAAHWQIDHSRTRRWRARVEHGMCVVALDDAPEWEGA